MSLENIDGGVRQVIVIKDSNQPKRYRFPMFLKPDQTFKKNIDESVNVIDNSNKTVLTILKPWAKDAKGINLQTYYEVEDKAIFQYINFENANFPVTADPAWCGGFWNSINWEDRKSEGGYTLSISPNWCGRQLFSLPQTFWERFKEVASYAPWDSQWQWGDRDPNRPTGKFWSMYKQFYCHADIAFWKEKWNLEPWRPDRRLRDVYNSTQPNGQLIPCNQN
jgi:hypothetical protein